MKQVVFNVGGALCSYIEFAQYKVVIDLGASVDFNPVLDFLIPLFKQRNALKSSRAQGFSKYKIDQCIISHPHKDHISAIADFDKSFYPDLLTCPNSNEGMNANEKINWQLVGNEDDESIKTLKSMLKGRKPPLRSVDSDFLTVVYLPAKTVEDDKVLSAESYINNVSIATFVKCEGYTILMPGDLQKEGLSAMIKRCSAFSRKLSKGVDVLIAPHHGLRSSFSTKLFETMKDKKTRCLHIISEKKNTEDSRNVDTRYSQAEYCKGENDLGPDSESHYQVRTSRGHIFLDYTNPTKLHVEIISDSQQLIEKFL